MLLAKYVFSNWRPARQDDHPGLCPWPRYIPLDCPPCISLSPLRSHLMRSHLFPFISFFLLTSDTSFLQGRPPLFAFVSIICNNFLSPITRTLSLSLYSSPAADYLYPSILILSFINLNPRVSGWHIPAVQFRRRKVHERRKIRYPGALNHSTVWRSPHTRPGGC